MGTETHDLPGDSLRHADWPHAQLSPFSRTRAVQIPVDTPYIGRQRLAQAPPATRVGEEAAHDGRQAQEQQQAVGLA
jgi:hypothetical protein